MTCVRGPSLITVLLTTLTFVMLTVLLMIVVLLTITVLGRTGWRKRRGSTKTNACRGMRLILIEIEPPLEIRAEGCNGAQPTYPPPSCHETHAGAHCVCGTQYQPNLALKSHLP